MAKLVVLHNAGQKRPTGDVGPINFLPVSYLQSLSWSIPRVKTQKYGLDDFVELVRGTWWGPPRDETDSLIVGNGGELLLVLFLGGGQKMMSLWGPPVTVTITTMQDCDRKQEAYPDLFCAYAYVYAYAYSYAYAFYNGWRLRWLLWGTPNHFVVRVPNSKFYTFKVLRIVKTDGGGKGGGEISLPIVIIVNILEDHFH